MAGYKSRFGRPQLTKTSGISQIALNWFFGVSASSASASITLDATNVAASASIRLQAAASNALDAASISSAASQRSCRRALPGRI